MNEIEMQNRGRRVHPGEEGEQLNEEEHINLQNQENQNEIPNNNPGRVNPVQRNPRVVPEDAYYNPEIKLYEISEQLKKLLEDNQIPIPVENSKFKHKMTANKERQYYGELVKLTFDEQQIVFFNDIKCFNGIRFLNQLSEQQDGDHLFFHGQGHLLSEAQFYSGQFFFGLMHGKGTLIRFGGQQIQIGKDQRYFFGNKYEVCFNLNELEYNTQINGNNGGKFYFKGQEENQGKYQWKDGSKYVGQFQNRKMHGFGIMYFVNGNQFEGQWRNGQMHGFGEYYWKNGDKFIGFYQSGLKWGFGHYIWANGMEYIGMYEDGLQHGDGYLKQKKHRPRLLKWHHNEVKQDKDQNQDQDQFQV